MKAVLGRHFSLIVFGFTQVAMDLEPLIRMLRGDTLVHGLSHTYLGATAIGIASLLVGRPVCQWLLGYWTPGTTGFGARFMGWLRGPRTISWPAAISGAFIGAYSHVLLDSVMHPEMQPFWPFTEENSLLGQVSIEGLHLSCLAAGALGLVGLVAGYRLFGHGSVEARPSRPHRSIN